FLRRGFRRFFRRSTFLLLLLFLLAHLTSPGSDPSSRITGDEGSDTPYPSFDNVPALFARACSAPIAENLTGHAGVLLAVFANDSNIGNVDRSFLFHNAALNVALRVRTRMALDHLDAFDDDLLILRYNDQDTPGFPAILSAEDENLVILFNRRNRRH